jgi:thiol-disulfide isomerase/thioredoxin
MSRISIPLLALSALVAAACQKQETLANETSQAAAVPTKGVDRVHKGTPAPDVSFADPDGGEISLAEFKGAPVLVNLWATWCAPCVKELPTLNALARKHDEDGRLAVIAVSQDMAPQGSVEAFLSRLKVDDLGAYHDPKMALAGALNAQVMPTTILYDAEGREVWRYIGDLDWTGPEAAKLLADTPSADPQG